MKKLILLPVIALITMIPGDSSGFVRGGGGRGGAAPRPAPAVHAAAARPAARSAAFIPHASPAVGGARSVGRPAAVGRVGGADRSVAGGSRLRAVPNRSAYASRGIYVNRSNGGLYRPGYAHYYNNYAGWHHGYWNGWYTRPWLWGGGALGAGWLLSSAYANYSNPYYSAPAMPFYDYGQALAVPDPELLDSGYDDGTGGSPPAQVANDSTDPNVVAAGQLVDQARQAFKAGDYDKAQQLIDKAVSLSPKDTTIHEFRALVLFARQKYPEATATIYGVLAVAPGWDWTTLSSFYADTKTYEQQLRTLEAFAKANPNDAASRFLLAYHYLTIEDRNAAMRMLRSVVTLQPKDLLAAHLLNMLEGQGGDPNRPTSGPS